MRPHPPETKVEARRLYVEQGLGVNEIGRKLGVTGNTVKLWLDDEYRLRHNQISRLRKARYRGVCRDCGGPTSHGGGTGKRLTSVRCQKCRTAYLAENRTWTAEKVVAAIQRWAKEHDGVPPTASQWMRRGEYWPPATGIYGTDASVPFRYWNDAIAAAGFTPRPTSPGPGNITWSREEAIRLREEGLSDPEIAARVGVSASAIYQTLGRRTLKPAISRRRRTRQQRIAALQQALEKENP